MKVARNEKRKKLLGFSFYINIGNFEAFLRNLNLSANRLFWRCGNYSSIQSRVTIFYFGVCKISEQIRECRDPLQQVLD